MTRFFTALRYAWAAFWEFYRQSTQVDQIADAVAQQSTPEPRNDFQQFELDLEEIMACGSDQDRAAAAKVQEHIELVNADPTTAMQIFTHEKTVVKMSDGSDVVITPQQDDNIPEIRHPYYLDERGNMRKPGQ